MLVLSRRVGESIVIGDDIVISVLEVKGDVVRIGVDAPRAVQVRRQELLEEVAATNKSAVSPDPAAVAGLSKLVGGAGRTDSGSGSRPAE
jgi:carbon storage regulator